MPKHWSILQKPARKERKRKRQEMASFKLVDNMEINNLEIKSLLSKLYELGTKQFIQLDNGIKLHFKPWSGDIYENSRCLVLYDWNKAKSVTRKPRQIAKYINNIEDQDILKFKLEEVLLNEL
jgi:hypothetical protein